MSKKDKASDAQAADGTDAPADKPKKSKKKLIIIALIVLLAVGYEAQSILLQPHYKVGQKVPAGVVSPIGQLTINLSDGHLAQVTVALQLTSVAASKTIGTDLPMFEDAITTVFGDQTYAGLLKPAGRLAAKAQILQLCQKIAGTVDGAAQQISGIYFTGFVIQ